MFKAQNSGLSSLVKKTRLFFKIVSALAGIEDFLRELYEAFESLDLDYVCAFCVVVFSFFT